MMEDPPWKHNYQLVPNLPLYYFTTQLLLEITHIPPRCGFKYSPVSEKARPGSFIIKRWDLQEHVILIGNASEDGWFMLPPFYCAITAQAMALSVINSGV